VSDPAGQRREDIAAAFDTAALAAAIREVASGIVTSFASQTIEHVLGEHDNMIKEATAGLNDTSPELAGFLGTLMPAALEQLRSGVARCFDAGQAGKSASAGSEAPEDERGGPGA
jgi:hypothetical protein